VGGGFAQESLALQFSVKSEVRYGILVARKFKELLRLETDFGDSGNVEGLLAPSPQKLEKNKEFRGGVESIRLGQ
jgi:hypothetical protein